MFTNKPCKQAVSKELAEACVDITRCSEDPLSSPGSIPVEQTQTEKSHQNIWKGLLTLFFQCCYV